MTKTNRIDIGKALQVLRYDPDSGKFFWLVNRGGRAFAGTVAGSLQNAPGALPYVCITLNCRPVRAHRLAWTIFHGMDIPDGMDIDHINGIRTDNRASNLRVVTRSQNLQNQRKAHSNAKSGLLGAHWHRASGTWHARIKTDGKEISLGYFKTPEEAHTMYAEAKRRLHIRGTAI